MYCAISNIKISAFVLFIFCVKQYTFSLTFPKMNAKVVIDKPIADNGKIFVQFLFNYFDIYVLVH